MGIIKNIRRGLATNSSSSHSLVYFNDSGRSDKNIYPASVYENEFGWDNFRLYGLGEKLFYALVQAVGNSYWYGSDGPSDDEIAGWKNQYGHLFPEFDDEYYVHASNGYVDHQSVTSDIEGLVTEIRKTNVVVYGGNDNSYDYDDDLPDGAVDRVTLG